MSKTIEYFFAAHSAYSYLGAWELDRIAQAQGCTILYRPFDFLPVIEAAKAIPFPNRTQAHVDYFFGRELIRWAEWRRLPIQRFRPTHHDNSLAFAHGMLIASRTDAGPLSRAMLQAHWRDDADLADAETLKTCARIAGLDGDSLLSKATSPDIMAQHTENTQEAIKRGIPGAPTYFVGTDMFYGQDRLMMVERALSKPFAP